MKKWMLTLSVLFLFACKGESAPANNVTLQKQVDSLRAELEDVKLILQYGVLRGEKISSAAPRIREVAKRQEQEQARRDSIRKIKHEIPIDGSPVYGPANAKVTVVEFSDFECPYCYRASTQVQMLAKKHPKDVRVIFKHFPLSFHKNARPAHAASMAAQKQGKFWEFRYKLAPHYRELTEAKFLEIAKELGLDMEKFKADMKLSAASTKKIDADMALGSKVGVGGTPTFYVNGKLVEGFNYQMVVDQFGLGK